MFLVKLLLWFSHANLLLEDFPFVRVKTYAWVNSKEFGYRKWGFNSIHSSVLEQLYQLLLQSLCFNQWIDWCIRTRLHSFQNFLHSQFQPKSKLWFQDPSLQFKSHLNDQSKERKLSFLQCRRLFHLNSTHFNLKNWELKFKFWILLHCRERINLHQHRNRYLKDFGIQHRRIVWSHFKWKLCLY